MQNILTVEPVGEQDAKTAHPDMVVKKNLNGEWQRVFYLSRFWQVDYRDAYIEQLTDKDCSQYLWVLDYDSKTLTETCVPCLDPQAKTYKDPETGRIWECQSIKDNFFSGKDAVTEERKPIDGEASEDADVFDRRYTGPLGPTFAELDKQARGGCYDDFDEDDNEDYDDEDEELLDYYLYEMDDEDVAGETGVDAGKGSALNGKPNNNSSANWPSPHTPDADDGFNWDDGMPPIPVIVSNFL